MEKRCKYSHWLGCSTLKYVHNWRVSTCVSLNHVMGWNHLWISPYYGRCNNKLWMCASKPGMNLISVLQHKIAIWHNIHSSAGLACQIWPFPQIVCCTVTPGWNILLKYWGKAAALTPLIIDANLKPQKWPQILFIC